jgi:hypothetical protein
MFIRDEYFGYKVSLLIQCSVFVFYDIFIVKHVDIHSLEHSKGLNIRVERVQSVFPPYISTICQTHVYHVFNA